MKKLEDLEKNPSDSQVIRDKAMEMIQFIFSRSQENLVKPMPWGNADKPSGRSPTTISDQSGILLGATVPRWASPNRIEFAFTAPHSSFVEFGTDPHPVAASIIEKWVNRKLGISGKEGLRAAYAISNAIKKRGIAPHPYLRPAIDEAMVRFNLKMVEEPLK